MHKFSEKLAPLKGLFFVFLPTGLLKIMVKWPILFGLPFILIPTIVTIAFWTGGTPPAYSLFWDRQSMTVVESRLAQSDFGNGTRAGAPFVIVRSKDGIEQPLQSMQHGKGLVDGAYLELQDFPDGEQVKVLVAPDGGFHDARFKWPHIVAYLLTFICPFFYFIGWAIIKS